MKRIKKNIFNLLRNILLKNITNSLGKIKETDKKITCYVNNKKIRNLKKGKYIPYYSILLKSKKIYPEEILNSYKVNKPIHYVINGMNFKTAVEVIAPEDTTIVFVNCKFNREFNVFSGGDVILENNEYCDEEKFYKNDIFFCTIKAKSLKFLNDNFTNISKYNIETSFGIKIDTDNLEIINSIFSTKKKDGMVSIITKNAYIEDSDIKCHKEIYIKANELKALGTKIKSETEVVIDNKNEDNYVIGVTSFKTIYNGIDLTKYYCLNSENL